MATSVTISYDAFGAQLVAGTFRVTAGLKNGVTIPRTIEDSSRIIYSSDLNTFTRLIEAAPPTPDKIEFYDTMGSRFCTLAEHRKLNTFGSVTNTSTMPNLMSNIQFPEPGMPTYLVMSSYPGLLECASQAAKKSFLQQDMELLELKYPLNHLSVFTSKGLYDEIMEIEPTFWTTFKEVLVAPQFTLAAFITEYLCGRYVTEKVSNSTHMLTFGSKVLTAQFFNSSVKAIARNEGIQISACGTVETNFIVFLENPDETDIVVTDKGTGVVFQPTLMWNMEPGMLHSLIAANKFYRRLPTNDHQFQEFTTKNSSDVVQYMFYSPLKVFDTMKGLNELEQNIVTFGRGLRLSIYNKLNQSLQMANPSSVSTFAWGGGPPAPQADLMLGRQHSCALASNDM